MRAPRLVGRAHELAALRRMLGEARSGASSVVCLEGTPGIGKTALLRAAVAMARESDFTVVTAQASAIERDFPFAVVRQLFEPVIARASSAERMALLTGSAVHATQALTAEPPAPGIQVSPALLHATFHGLYWLTANLTASSPVLLAVDEVQWADAPSLRWLSYLLRRIESMPLVVLFTLTIGEEAAEAHLVTDLVNAAYRVRLDALAAEDVASLAEDVFGVDTDPDFAAACHAATGGNPFLIRELLYALEHEDVKPTAEAVPTIRELGPQALARSVTARLQRHALPVTALARAVAVLEECDLETAAALAELDPPVAADAARALVEMDVLTARPALAFNYSLVRKAVLYELAHTQRAAMHGRAAALLWRAHAPAERVATHLLRTCPLGEPWAVEPLRVAAAHALSQGAPRSAVSYLRRALREPAPDPVRRELRVQLALAEIHVDLPAVHRHIPDLLEQVENPDQVAFLARTLGRTLYEHDQYREAAEILERGVERIGRGHPAARNLEIGRLAMAFLVPDLAGERPLERLAALWPPEEGSPVDERFLAAILAYRWSWEATCSDQIVELARRAVRAGLSHQVEDPGAVSAAVCALLWADEAELAYRVCDEAAGELRRRGHQLFYAVTCAYRARIAARLGRLADAREDAQIALELFDGLSGNRARGSALVAVAALVEALTGLGELDAAEFTLAGRGLGDVVPEVWHGNYVLHCRGRLRMARGDVRGALADQLECGRRLLRWGVVNPALFPWRSEAALAHAALGEPVAAGRLAAEEVELARRWGRPRALGVALRAQGITRGGAEGARLLAEAAARLAEAGDRYEYARALADLGAALRVLGQRAEARRHLQKAIDLAEVCGAGGLADRARGELRALGARPLSGRACGPRALTAHEYRIAQLAAEGRTNREIAEAFFVTQRTVELHLTNVYRKLGITRRAQLATALAAVQESDSGGSVRSV
ncbi:ATP-binding protein [Carbonactinospora thermoautotrophica]|uniref:ATP-binding protein n=1 Tax=Carbonactinospora thermoautotrophica TaxID=1469144 RepID=UPI000A57B686|nr:BREX system ATP-binding domain-containing protein [Carbonactinospora thermoautotrophica]